MLDMYWSAPSIASSGTAIPALRAPSSPISTAPVTDVSASRERGP
ncbi:MAG: hypothetical protein AAFR54_14370 [Planctomycetota bacterium]